MTRPIPELNFLTDHVSVPAAELCDPAPDPEQLDAILQSAMSAPDHGNLQPFRFIVIQHEAREKLSQVFEKAAQDKQLDAQGVLKQKQKPLRSPMIICVVAHITPSPKIPEIEQLLSAGCAAHHVQLACRNLGFGSIWLTGENCYDQSVYQALGLDIDERLVGFIYVGSLKSELPKKTRNSAREITSYWTEIQASPFAI
jgi:nitroreductase